MVMLVRIMHLLLHPQYLSEIEKQREFLHDWVHLIPAAFDIFNLQQCRLALSVRIALSISVSGQQMKTLLILGFSSQTLEWNRTRINLEEIGGELSVITITTFSIFKFKINSHKSATPGYSLIQMIFLTITNTFSGTCANKIKLVVFIKILKSQSDIFIQALNFTTSKKEKQGKKRGKQLDLCLTWAVIEASLALSLSISLLTGFPLFLPETRFVWSADGESQADSFRLSDWLSLLCTSFTA